MMLSSMDQDTIRNKPKERTLPSWMLKPNIDPQRSRTSRTTSDQASRELRCKNQNLKHSIRNVRTVHCMNVEELITVAREVLDQANSSEDLITNEEPKFQNVDEEKFQDIGLEETLLYTNY